MQKAYLLAFDCALPQASLALLQKDSLHKETYKLLLEKTWEHKAFVSPHSLQLFVEIEQALKELKLSLKDLSALSVGLGPGRFTGVRTAVCVAKSLSYSLKIPIYSTNSLQIVLDSFLKGRSYQEALAQHKAKSLCVSIYAFKNQVYWLTKDSTAQVLSLEAWEKAIQKLPSPLLCLSDIPDFQERKKESSLVLIKPKISAFYLGKRALETESKTWEQISPLYLRTDF